MDKLLKPDVLFTLLTFGLPIICVIGYLVYSLRNHQSDNELKRSMIERGMSAEEIERVLAAGREEGKRKHKGVK